MPRSVTACIVPVGTSPDLEKTRDSVAARRWEVAELALADLESLATHEVWTKACASVSTDWCLLLLPGETVEVIRDEWLASDLADTSVQALSVIVDRRGTPLPRLFDPGDVRLLRRDAVARQERPSGARRTAVRVLSDPGAHTVDTSVKEAILSLVGRDHASRQVPSNAEQLFADACALAAVGELDAAFIRGRRLLREAVDHPLVPAAARLVTLTGLATGRSSEAALAAAEWAAVDPPGAWWQSLSALLTKDFPLLRIIADSDAEHPADGSWRRLAADLALVGLDNAGLIADATLDSMGPQSSEALAHQLVHMWQQLGRPAEELVRGWPREADQVLLALLDTPVTEPHEQWLALVAGYASVRGLPARLLRRLVGLAPRMSLSEALSWTALVQGTAHRQESLLRRRAASDQLPAAERALTAAAAVHAFDDRAAQAILLEQAAAVPVPALRALLLAVDQLAPTVLPLLIEGACSTSDRARALADLLEEFGAPEQAEALRQAAQTLPAP